MGRPGAIPLTAGRMPDSPLTGRFPSIIMARHRVGRLTKATDSRIGRAEPGVAHGNGHFLFCFQRLSPVSAGWARFC